MLQPQRIGHVVLKVRDIDRSIQFYRDVLGFQVVGQMSNVMRRHWREAAAAQDAGLHGLVRVLLVDR